MPSTDSGLPLEPDTTPPVPRWRGRVLAEPTIENLFDAMASDLMLEAIDAVTGHGTFHFAIGGSEALQPLLERLMLDPGLRGMPWEHTHIWQADEHCALEGEAGAAWARIHDTLVPHAGLTRHQLHPMPAGDEIAPAHYAKRLHRALEGRHVDCLLLDAGEDGRIGGMAPGQAFGGDDVAFTKVNDQDVITLTPVAAARACVYVLVPSSLARRRLDRDMTAEASPTARLLRHGSRMHWCIPSEALQTKK